MGKNNNISYPDEFKRKFSDNLLTYLGVRNMTQQELAEKIGVCSSNVSCYVCCKTLPTPFVLAKIANVLDVSLDLLLPRELAKLTPVVLEGQEELPL